MPRKNAKNKKGFLSRDYLHTKHSKVMSTSVQLKEFRCWKNLKITIPLRGVVLLKGGSGSGKSTILQAIAWCVYGNVRSVTPNHLDPSKAKTKVSFHSPKIFIKRCKAPNRLLVIYKDVKYTGKVAQSLLEQLFGNYDVWLASCLVSQGSRNSFLTSPNTGKMELLNSLAFHEEEPSVYISKIDEKIKSSESSFETLLDAFKKQICVLEKEAEGFSVKEKMGKDEIFNLEKRLQSEEKNMETLLILDHKRKVELGILSSLGQQLEEFDEKLAKFSPDDLESPCALKSQMEDISRCIPMLKNVEEKREQILTLSRKISKIKGLPGFSEKDYREALLQETIYKDNEKRAKRIGCNYNSKDVALKIAKNDEILCLQSFSKIFREKSACDRKINSLEELVARSPPEVVSRNIPVPDFSIYSTSKMEAALEDIPAEIPKLELLLEKAEASKTIIDCPSCNSPLRYIDGLLVQAERDFSATKDTKDLETKLASVKQEKVALISKMNSMKKKEESHRKIYTALLEEERNRIFRLEHERDRLFEDKKNAEAELQEQRVESGNLESALMEYPGNWDSRVCDLLPEHRIEKLRLENAALKSIKCVGLPSPSSLEILSAIKHRELTEKKAQLEKFCNDVSASVPEAFLEKGSVQMEQLCKTLEKRTRTLYQNIDRFETLKRDREMLDLKIHGESQKATPDPTPEIMNATLEIKTLKEHIRDAIKSNEIMEKHGLAEKEREKLVDLSDGLAKIRDFRCYAEETECLDLQNTAESINTCMQEICECLFEKKIVVTIELFKTGKTSKITKPVVNFTISYQGGTFDNVNQMSGGEADRASIALTLSLNKLSFFPLLMLDESLSSLDVDTKEKSVKAIEENIFGCALVVMHDGIEGIFSDVIDLDSVVSGRY